MAGTTIIGGSPGADTIDGGEDIDTVDYYEFDTWIPPRHQSGDAVDVDLERSVQFGGLAEGDVLINIENVIGSGENDIIKGDGADNELVGNGGDDIVEGRGGDDVLRGDRRHRLSTTTATITSMVGPAMTSSAETAATTR